MIARKIPAVVVLLLAACQLARAESWEERMWRQVNKKVSIELVDTKLSEACDLVSRITGLTIILAPSLRQSDPSFSARLQDMDAGTVIKWFTILTDTHAELVNQAIYITDKPLRERVEAEKEDLMVIGAAHGLTLDMPPPGMPLTDLDRAKIALLISEKEAPKIQDFPGPTVGFDASEQGVGFKFGNQ